LAYVLACIKKPAAPYAFGQVSDAVVGLGGCCMNFTSRQFKDKILVSPNNETVKFFFRESLMYGTDLFHKNGKTVNGVGGVFMGGNILPSASSGAESEFLSLSKGRMPKFLFKNIAFRGIYQGRVRLLQKETAISQPERG